VRGGPGTGKTALLEYLGAQASGCRVARIVAIQSEMELAFAGLHQLAAPMLDRLDSLPKPQQDAMRVAAGVSAGPAPDRFILGLALLGLLSEADAEQPLVCLIDDAQWLDQASAQVLGFVAPVRTQRPDLRRRLHRRYDRRIPAAGGDGGGLRGDRQLPSSVRPAGADRLEGP
jgi:hypothetical protein